MGVFEAKLFVGRFERAWESAHNHGKMRAHRAEEVSTTVSFILGQGLVQRRGRWAQDFCCLAKFQ